MRALVLTFMLVLLAGCGGVAAAQQPHRSSRPRSCQPAATGRFRVVRCGNAAYAVGHGIRLRSGTNWHPLEAEETGPHGVRTWTVGAARSLCGVAPHVDIVVGGTLREARERVMRTARLFRRLHLLGRDHVRLRDGVRAERIRYEARATPCHMQHVEVRVESLIGRTGSGEVAAVTFTESLDGQHYTDLHRARRTLDLAAAAG